MDEGGGIGTREDIERKGSETTEQGVPAPPKREQEADNGQPIQTNVASQEQGSKTSLDMKEKEMKITGLEETAKLNLSGLSLKPHPSNQKLDLSQKKKFYSDSNLMNDSLVGKQVESFKVKLKERQSEKSWAHLTMANLQTLTKSQEQTNKQHSFQRIRRWVQDSQPPYEANPSPGVSSLRSMPPAERTCWIFQVCSCFGNP